MTTLEWMKHERDIKIHTKVDKRMVLTKLEVKENESIEQTTA